jgi:hypothetical protein
MVKDIVPQFAVVTKDRGECPFVVMREDTSGVFRPAAQFRSEESAYEYIETETKRVDV